MSPLGLLAGVCLVLVAGCPGSSSEDLNRDLDRAESGPAPETDSGAKADGGDVGEEKDASELDASAANLLDAGGLDAQGDAGSEAMLDAADGSMAADTGALDGGELDSGARDSGELDSGELDSAQLDTATPIDAAPDASPPEDAARDVGPQGCNAGDFSFDEDFSQGLRPAYWKVTHQPAIDAGGGIFSYADDAGVLHFAKVGQNAGGLKNIGAVLDLTAAGGPVLEDFMMYVDFRDAVLGASAIDQIELHAQFGDGTIFYNVYSNENGLEFHVWDGAFRGLLRTSANAGRFKIQRVGTTLSAYAVIAADGGLEEKLVYTKQQPEAPEVTLVRFVAQVFNTNNAISVTFDDFHIEGSCAIK